MNQEQLSPEQRSALKEYVGRKMDHMSDEELVNLLRFMIPQNSLEQPEKAPAETVKAQPGSPQEKRDPMSRRKFLFWMFAGSAAAACGGLTAAAYLNSKPDSLDQAVAQILNSFAPQDSPAESGKATPTEAQSASAAQPTTEPTEIATTTDGSPDEVEKLRAELIRLRNEHAQLQNQLSNAESDLQGAKGEVTDLNATISQYEQQLGTSRSLNDLYTQLEAVGLDEIVLAGLGPVGLTLIGTSGLRTVASTGLQTAQSALNELEGQIPAVANGILWAEEQVRRISEGLTTIQGVISQAVDPVTPFGNMVGDFVGFVLDNLPFGIGQPIRDGLTAIGNLIANLPELVNGINTMLLEPIRLWVSPGAPGGLMTNVVTPIRTGALHTTAQLVDNTGTLETQYNTQLDQPSRAAIAERQVIQQRIAALRAQ